MYNPWITQGIPCGNPVYSTVYKDLSRTLLTIHCIHTLFHGFSIIRLLLFHYLYILPNIMFFNALYHLLFNFSTLSTSHHQHYIFLLCIKEIKKGKEYIIMIFSMVMAKVWRICGGAVPGFLHIVPLGSLGSLHPSRTPVFLSAHPSSIAFHTEYYVVMAVMPTLQVSGNPHSFIYTPYPFTRRMKLLFFIGINKIREIYIKKDRNRRYNLLFFL